MRWRSFELGALLALACSSKPPAPPTLIGGSGGAPPAPPVAVDPEPIPNPIFQNGGAGGNAPRQQNLLSLRIEPADAVLSVPRGQTRQLAYHAFGRLEDAPDTEIELTERTVFYVPDQYLVAGFPPDGSAVLGTRLPLAGEFAQRGGRFAVQAQAANSDGSITLATTQASVLLTDQSVAGIESPEGTPALPAEPAAQFAGNIEPALAPLLVYPNAGALLPPNLGRLELHFERGSAGGSLFELTLSGAFGELVRYTRCYSDPAQFVAGACQIAVTGPELESLAASSQGQGPVSLRVRASDENGHLGVSAPVEIEFAAERIDGAVYYWSATEPESIVRFDFGSGQSAPETFLAPGDIPGNDDDTCVGCHALSPQGDKVFFSLDSATAGQLMYASDLSRARDAADFFTYNGATSDRGKPLAQQQNRVLTGSFSPDGAHFVAAAPTNDAADDHSLFLHDATTGQREGSILLPFIPSHPDWSPLGDAIAMTNISGTNGVTIAFTGGGVSLIRRNDEGWEASSPISVVPPQNNKNSFNPTFLPDASLLLYTQIDGASYRGSQAGACTTSNVFTGRFCDGYSDPASKTWAVAPAAGATPVFLANAAQPGLADVEYPPTQTDVGLGDLMDTFPKPTPFQITHRGRRLTWFTVSSQRHAGLRRRFPNTSITGEPATQSLLWMFALDAERVLSGQDGSHAGFFLPFQDLATSNHMAQWTKRVVTDSAQPPPRPVPAPPAPPPPPPLPDLR